MKLLLVDDSNTMRRIQKNTLQNLGFNEVDEAEDGEEALKKVAANEYDLVLMDWNMPNLSGLDALKKMKADDQLKNIPVMMVTSESEKSRIVEAIQAGAANYVVKPFKPNILEEKIKAVLAALKKG